MLRLSRSLRDSTTQDISDSRFDLVWFRLSCDHGWIRSGSVNVRKQQQQQDTDMPEIQPVSESESLHSCVLSCVRVG